MALTTTAAYKTSRSIAVADDDSVIDTLRVEAEALIGQWCNRRLEDTQSDQTEYYDGAGDPAIHLKAWPVSKPGRSLCASGNA